MYAGSEARRKTNAMLVGLCLQVDEGLIELA
jgi:hypothetical protein